MKKINPSISSIRRAMEGTRTATEAAKRFNRSRWWLRDILEERGYEPYTSIRRKK